MITLKKLRILTLLVCSILLLQTTKTQAAKRFVARAFAAIAKAVRGGDGTAAAAAETGDVTEAELAMIAQHEEDAKTERAEAIERNSIPGLKNFGTSCYFNATMQCLASLEPLNEFLRRRPVAAENYLPLVNQMNAETDNLIVPTALYTTIAEILGEDQQDAHECYDGLIDRIFRNLSHRNKAQLQETIYPIVGTYIWDEHGHDSINFNQPSPSLSLAIMEENPTLENCLNNYFGEAELSGDNQWNCVGCARLIDAHSQQSITNFPTMLTIQLKRFGFDRATLRPVKNTAAVSFPLKLQIQSRWAYEVGQERCPMYNLVGFVVQGGDLNGGHYWSYTKRGDQWHKCNDYRTNVCTDKEIEAMAISGVGADGTATPYLLFYQRSNFASGAAMAMPGAAQEEDDDKEDKEGEDDVPASKPTTRQKRKKQPIRRAPRRKARYLK